MAEARRKRQTLIAVGAIAVVVVIVVVFVVVKLAGGGKAATTSNAASDNVPLNTPVTPAQYAAFTSPSAATLAAAATNYHDPPYLVAPTVTKDPALTKDGLPEVLYIGAEYCPYCATERWAMVLALSKLGTFHGLNIIHSSPTDVYPNTPTWSFYGSSYSSKYLNFTPVEETTVYSKPLQSPTAQENRLLSKYDTSSDIPFVYLDGKAIIVGAEYNPQLLQGKTFAQVVDEVHAGGTTLANNIYANAGMILSDLCQATGGKPASVCRYFPKPIGG